eukprot:6186622-Pleurochrysis_carterae.AAC.1
MRIMSASNWADDSSTDHCRLSFDAKYSRSTLPVRRRLPASATPCLPPAPPANPVLSRVIRVNAQARAINITIHSSYCAGRATPTAFTVKARPHHCFLKFNVEK